MTDPAPQPFLPFARPSITEREKQAVLDVLDSGWLTTGPQAKLFEERFAAKVGARYAIALNSATAALHLALEALGIGPGDEVIVPTWTFAASAEVVVYRGARPVLVDVDRRTLEMPRPRASSAVTARTRAVIAVHVAGLPVDIERLVTLLEAKGIAVVEDAAHAFPSRIGGQGPAPTPAPSGGPERSPSMPRRPSRPERAECSSRMTTRSSTARPRHVVARHQPRCVEPVRLDRLVVLRDRGRRVQVQPDGHRRGARTRPARARGRSSSRLVWRIAASYSEGLRGIPRCRPPRAPAGCNVDELHAWHLYVVRLELERLGLDRGAVIEASPRIGIGTSVHFIPLDLHPYYRRRWGSRAEDHPVATKEYERVVSLPIWPGMTDADVTRVVETLASILVSARSG